MSNIEIIGTRVLHEKIKEEMITLTKRVSKAEGMYLLTRLEIYDQIICLKRNQKLFAFQLIQTFEQGDDKFVYFGPLFSRMSCFLELFMTYLQVLMEETVGRKVHLLAEIENPEVLLLFKALFDDCAYPKFQEEQVPEGVKNHVQTFKKSLAIFVTLM
ncbi:hypothetical protein [Bacillus timonensis]|uniref:hypothetical protein n=1 Tax=Bacillus timonensis TaxID=1033734 RepID=UPI0002883F22|nr:hypothetical protein [Bacillus timonensis]